jgi:hypothetical protein
MPFKSKKQRKWMHANKPKMAKKWEKEESVKEARTINVEPNWEGMWKFFKQMAITNPSDWKRMERTLGSDWKKIDAMAKKNKWTESVNENKKDQVYWQLVKNGDRPSEAKKVLDKYYDKVNKMYRNASVQKKAEIISALSARNEGSCGYGIDGKVGKEPAGPHLLKRKKKKTKEGLGDKISKKLGKHKGTSVAGIKPSGIMAKINKIVQSKQAAKIDGVLMDMFSANIMMRIFNAVNDKSKKDMNKGTMRQVKVVLNKVMKHNKVTK